MFQYNGFEQNQINGLRCAVGKWEKAFISLHIENKFSCLQTLEGENIGDHKVSEYTIEEHVQLTLISPANPVSLMCLLSAYFINFFDFLLSEDITNRGPQITVFKRCNKSYYKADYATCILKNFK